jgi:hypothetical protein
MGRLESASMRRHALISREYSFSRWEETANRLFLNTNNFTILSFKFQRSLEKITGQNDGYHEEEKENKIELGILFYEGPLSRLIRCGNPSE